jgi:hypothetical protein
MASSELNTAPASSAATDTFFGIRLGGFGFISSLLLALTTGALSFFLFTFLSIIGVIVFNSLTHRGAMHSLDTSYKYIAFPAALLVMAVSLTFFMGLWIRNKFRA